MLSICMHTCSHSQSLSPHVNGCINNALLQIVPDINKALQKLTNKRKLIPVNLKPETA